MKQILHKKTRKPSHKRKLENQVTKKLSAFSWDAL